MTMSRKIILAHPRGFCDGVRKALDIVEQVLAAHPGTVYVYHEIVHNEYVVNDLRRRGVVFVDSLDEVPDGAPLIFSAHGVSKAIRDAAEARHLQITDATCRLVKDIHEKAGDFQRQGHEIVLIGHREHPEIIGTFGRLDRRSTYIVSEEADVAALPELVRPVWFSQTTLCGEDIKPVIEALKARFPGVIGGGGICPATGSRQRAVRELCAKCDYILVIGSPKSSNSKRLYEIALRSGKPARLIREPEEIDAEKLPAEGTIGITAAASAPEILVQKTLEYLAVLGWCDCIDLSGNF